MRFFDHKKQPIILTFIIIWILVQEWICSITTKLPSGVGFKASIISSNKIEYIITANSTGWVGFGYGSNMGRNDGFYIQAAGGAGTVFDIKFNRHNYPNFDTVNDYSISTSTSVSTNTYTLTRLLNDGDSGDYTIVNGKNNMIHAWGDGTFSDHGDNYLAFEMVTDLSSGSIQITGGIIIIDDSDTKKHGILAYVAWGWISVFLLITGRYSKYFYVVRSFFHSILAVSILLITLTAVYSIDDIETYSTTSSFFGENHKELGTSLIYLWIIAFVLGIATKSSTLFCRYSTVRIKAIRFAHSLISFLVIIYSQYVILTGLYTFQASVRYLYFVQIGAIFVSFVVIEVMFYFIGRKYYRALLSVKKKGLKNMTIKEFYESKRNLALFNDYVVDLTLYAVEHPGGRYLIQQCYKKDIGKYIYGAYSMENSVSPHKHSFIAMKIIKRLICAKIIPEVELELELDSNRSAARFVDDPNLIEVGAYSSKQISTYKVTNVEEISKNFYRVVFDDNEADEHRIFTKGIGLVWKHYLVISMRNQAARYYTICQTFHSKIYNQYLAAFDNVLTGKGFTRKFETIEQISNESSSSIEVFMKFYTQSKNGITKQIANVSQEDRYIVSGAFGKGLNFERERIIGTNLIVVGGTGVLPFIDLFGYLVRRLLNEKAHASQVFLREIFEDYMSEAKFIIYAYFPDKENSIGVEFCEKVAQLFQHFGWKDRFKFVPQYTRGGDKKISTNFDALELIKAVFQDTIISNIFVCGPPQMDNLFHQISNDICKEFKISPFQIEIL